MQGKHTKKQVCGDPATKGRKQEQGSQDAKEVAKVPVATQDGPISTVCQVVQAKLCKDMMGLPRGRASMLTQLRTGYIPLSKHLHRIRKAESPMCPACRTHNETDHHYLMACPAHAPQRRIMEEHLRCAARSIRTLLSNPKAFGPLFQFINSTEQFKSVFGVL